VKTAKPTNMAASVRARLLKLARESGEEFTYVLTRYGLERLLARLASSRYRDAFVLKGAMPSSASGRPDSIGRRKISIFSARALRNWSAS
jgi:hypothetical protein